MPPQKRWPLDRLTEIVGSKARPTTERAEAEMISERDLARNMRREVAHLNQITLDCAFERKARNGAVGVLQFGRAVPLYRELLAGIFSTILAISAPSPPRSPV